MKQLHARIEDVSNRDKGVQICFILKLGVVMQMSKQGPITIMMVDSLMSM